ncbi:MerR family transcriptional regulator [Parasedimentitalea psychrophila]|uniref:Uncharacterized protein n=1 Tax=Parasedimentitalea psychrophila TaxID=2997337 RepID=A0A9Y2L1C2_9RHOB|nr:hypothetical protein [Parasedimentitalea psychrophila]WIY26960.1 hypothetical protein QPJ95_08625 [Parasedimentitalea psychrophila]
MSFTDRDLTPKDVESLTGFSSQFLREWRRLEYLVGIGEQGANDRWKYSLKDALTLAICTQIRGSGLDGGVAIKIAKDFANTVLDQAGFFKETKEPRYLAVWSNSALPENRRQFPLDPLAPFATYQAELIGEIDHVVNAPAPIILDAVKVLDCLPKELFDALLKAKREMREQRKQMGLNW